MVIVNKRKRPTVVVQYIEWKNWPCVQGPEAHVYTGSPIFVDNGCVPLFPHVYTYSPSIWLASRFTPPSPCGLALVAVHNVVYIEEAPWICNIRPWQQRTARPHHTVKYNERESKIGRIEGYPPLVSSLHVHITTRLVDATKPERAMAMSVVCVRR